MELPVPLYQLFLAEVRKLWEAEATARNIELRKNTKLMFWAAYDGDLPLMHRVKFGTIEIRHFYEQERQIRMSPKKDIDESDRVIVAILSLLGFHTPNGWALENYDVNKEELKKAAENMFYEFLLRDHKTEVTAFTSHLSKQSSIERESSFHSNPEVSSLNENTETFVLKRDYQIPSDRVITKSDLLQDNTRSEADEKVRRNSILANAKSLKDLIGLLYSTDKEITTEDSIVSSAVENYIRSYEDRYAKIKVLGMPKPVNLEDVYTKVKVVNANPERFIIDIASYEKEFRTRSEKSRDSGKDDAINFLKRFPKLNVLGAPGAGKSTLLRRIGQQVLFAELDDEIFFGSLCIPVLLEFKYFVNVDSVEGIVLKIIREFELAGFPESDTFVEQTLNLGKFLILLDGLDEVRGSSLDSVIENIRDFTFKYSKNRFVCSCRTAFYKNYLSGFTDVEITGFDNVQIKTFIDKWFDTKDDLIAGTNIQLVSLLFDSANQAVLELARTPLLLTFLCIVFDAGQQFPKNRSSLYRRALDILLERWAAEKRIHHEDVYLNLNSDLEIQMLGEIAAYFFEKNVLLFHVDELRKHISIFLEETMDVLLPSSSKVLEAIEVQQGLLVERAMNIYSFSHLTIQEYLTAHHFNSPNRLGPLIEKHCFHERWREVFLLQAGMPHSEDLLMLLSMFLKKFADQDKQLKEVFSWTTALVYEREPKSELYLRLILLGLHLYNFRNNSEYKWLLYNLKVLLEYFSVIETANLKLPLILSIGESKNFLLGIGKGKLLRTDLHSAIEKVDNLSSEIIDKPEWERYLKLIQNQGLLDVEILRDVDLRVRKFNIEEKILSIIFEAMSYPSELKEQSNSESLVKYLSGMALFVECRKAALRISPKAWHNAISFLVC